MPFIPFDPKQTRELIPGFWVRFIHTEHMTLAHWIIEPHAELPEHRHPHEQVVNVIQGQFELTIEGETQTLNPGDIAVIPSQAKHSGKAITECKVIDAFYPIREDYR